MSNNKDLQSNASYRSQIAKHSLLAVTLGLLAWLCAVVAVNSASWLTIHPLGDTLSSVYTAWIVELMAALLAFAFAWGSITALLFLAITLRERRTSKSDR